MSHVAYLTLVSSALLMSFVLTPIAKLVGRRLGAMDTPNPLSIHSAPTPRTGGLAIFAGFLIAVCLAALITPAPTPLLLGILAAAGIVALVGFLDDRGTIPTKVEVSALVIPAVLVILLGIRVEFIPVIYLSVLLTLFYIVGGCSAMNLIDGMDGLAASVAAIAAVFLAILSLSREEPLGVILSLALLGAALGFLPYNFRRATIFMGDNGSLFLGFILVTVAVMLTSEPYDFPSLAAPILILGVPIADTFVAIVRRVFSRGQVLTGDRRHVYDLIRARGVGDTTTVLMICGISTIAGVTGLVVNRMDALPAFVIFAAAFVAFCAMAMWLGAPKTA